MIEYYSQENGVLPYTDLWSDYFSLYPESDSFNYWVIKLLYFKQKDIIAKLLLSPQYAHNNSLDWCLLFKAIYLSKMKEELLDICSRMSLKESLCAQLQYHLKLVLNITHHDLDALETCLEYPGSKEIERLSK